MKIIRYCFALDLINDQKLIDEYKNYHNKVWPEIVESIKSSGIESMEIYNISNRLFMIIEASENFSLKSKKQADKKNLIVQKWEKLMWSYQKALPMAKNEEKWIQMSSIFKL